MVALGVGAICLRTSGMAFIMITLAFAQMLYFLAVSLREYGGDDGMPLKGRSLFGALDLNNSTALYYLAYRAAAGGAVRLLAAGAFALRHGAARLPQQPAAHGLAGLSRRCATSSVAYVISALVCVLAGMLMANLTRFVSPSYMAWTVSGELIVMTVLGGLGTLIGPIAGATALLLVEEGLSSLKLGMPWLDTRDQPALAGADRPVHRARGAGAQAGPLRLAGGARGQTQ